jgi:hypothetical protein
MNTATTIAIIKNAKDHDKENRDYQGKEDRRGITEVHLKARDCKASKGLPFALH